MFKKNILQFFFLFGILTILLGMLLNSSYVQLMSMVFFSGAFFIFVFNLIKKIFNKIKNK